MDTAAGSEDSIEPIAHTHSRLAASHVAYWHKPSPADVGSHISDRVMADISRMAQFSYS
jgi:hypothetical protein